MSKLYKFGADKGNGKNEMIEAMPVVSNSTERVFRVKGKGSLSWMEICGKITGDGGKARRRRAQREENLTDLW